MPRDYQPVEFNTFVGGLVTEASPLNFPTNASLDEENFVLNKDGTRSRRLGVQFESGYEIIDSASSLVDGELVVSSFKWKNAGGLSTNTVICVQMGDTIDFFQGNAQTISLNKFHTYTFTGLDPVIRFSYASVDGQLVVATGQKEVYIFTYDNTKQPIDAISVSTKKLLIRDLFELDDIHEGKDLRSGTDISWRPTPISANHVYNLRNQGWATPRPIWAGNDDPQDVIAQFSGITGGQYPSNADNITAYIYPNTDSSSSKTIQRFDAKNMISNPPANTESPLGYFIIDALDRGLSRRDGMTDLAVKYPSNVIGVSSSVISLIKKDQTPSGATVVCEYAGRVWYAGFPGTVIDGDDHSPKMNSYALFSQLVNDSGDINLCYQAADPTDVNGSDLVDTDGGFIRLEGAYGICGMAVLQSTLFVLAENGIWSISGGAASGFTATNYQTAKITDAGCISQGSVVVMQDSIFYWGMDGIYAITRNEFGDFKAANITNKTIKSFYMGIPDLSIRRAEGIYDSYDGYVKWLYNNYLGADDDTIELNLDVNSGAYFKFRIKPLSGNYPLMIKGIQLDPYRIVVSADRVVTSDDSDVVVTDGSQVVINSSSQVSGLKEMAYLTLTDDSHYTFSGYSEPFHFDWMDIDGIGIDAPAYLLTGVLAGGDYQRGKQIVYQTTHFAKTETGVSNLVLTSRPYPIEQLDSLQVDVNSLSGLLKKELEIVDLQDFVSVSTTPIRGMLAGDLITTHMPLDSISVNSTPQSGELVSMLITTHMPRDELQMTIEPLEGELKRILVTYPNWPMEGVQLSVEPQSGTLST